jgi:hypothetical protein
MFRLPAGESELVPMPEAPAHSMVLYRSGGVIVAPMMDQRNEPPFASVGSISTDDGATWQTLPVPQ